MKLLIESSPQKSHLLSSTLKSLEKGSADERGGYEAAQMYSAVYLHTEHTAISTSRWHFAAGTKRNHTWQFKVHISIEQTLLSNLLHIYILHGLSSIYCISILKRCLAFK